MSWGLALRAGVFPSSSTEMSGAEPDLITLIDLSIRFGDDFPEREADF